MPVIDLLPIDDTWFSTDTGSSPQGGSTTFEMGRMNGRNDMGQPLLKFDLSFLKPGTIINSATLRLTATAGFNYLSGSSAGVRPYRVTSAWNEATLTTANIPTSVVTADSQVNYAGSSYTASSVFSLSVVNTVRDIISNGTNHGIHLTHQSSGASNGWAGVQFASKEHPTVASRPVLRIDYVNTAPNTPIINNPKGTSSAPSTIATLTPLLDWSFSDPDPGDAQSKFQVRIKKASDNSMVHDTGLVTSQVTDYQVPANVLTPNTVYYWEVLTQDAVGVASAYSSAEYFKVVPAEAPGTVYSFARTGAVQTFTVPGGTTKIRVEAWGAEGGQGELATAYPGKGGYAKAEYTVNPGDVFNIYVGGKGSGRNGATGGTGGYNGGGNGGNGVNHGGGGGGGASDIRKGGTALTNRILVAGGGGGTSYGGGGTSYGGGGGGLTGQNAVPTINVGIAYGGTQTAGGINESGAGQSGTLGNGGVGQSGSFSHAGAGGGGGYYGGAAGIGNGGSNGAGGSGYVSPTNLIAGSDTMTQNTRSGDGQVRITVIDSVTATVTNRAPGTTDSLNPAGSTVTPFFTWEISDPGFVQSKFQIKIFDGNTQVHDSGLVSNTLTSYQTPGGILISGKVYGWEVTVQDANGISLPSSRLYFITNRPPGAPIAVNPVDNYRTGLRPTFWATIGDDVEDNPQKFVIQIANDAGFTSGVQERSTETSVGGWQSKTTTGVYTDMPVGGVDASFEGGTVKYTWSTDLIEGTTYFWRMAGIDATTGSRGAWSAPRRIRVGNKITMMLKAPVETSESIERLLIRAQFQLATDGETPATVKFEACNNAYDEAPTWEDVTAAVIHDDYFNFTNHTKTAEKWGLNLRILFEANDSLEPIELYGLGISFD